MKASYQTALVNSHL